VSINYFYIFQPGEVHHGKQQGNSFPGKPLIFNGLRQRRFLNPFVCRFGDSTLNLRNSEEKQEDFRVTPACGGLGLRA
jgi:hypothetical protein